MIKIWWQRRVCNLVVVDDDKRRRRLSEEMWPSHHHSYTMNFLLFSSQIQPLLYPSSPSLKLYVSIPANCLRKHFWTCSLTERFFWTIFDTIYTGNGNQRREEVEEKNDYSFRWKKNTWIAMWKMEKESHRINTAIQLTATSSLVQQTNLWGRTCNKDKWLILTLTVPLHNSRHTWLVMIPSTFFAAETGGQEGRKQNRKVLTHKCKTNVASTG